MNDAEWKKLFPKVQQAQPSWKEDGTRMVPLRPNTSGVPHVPPAQQPLPQEDHSNNKIPLGPVIPRVYRADEDGGEFVTMVIYVNGALATADVLAKNVTPL